MRQAYTLLLERETEQSFSKSKSSTVLSMVSRNGQLLLRGCSEQHRMGRERERERERERGGGGGGVNVHKGGL